MKDIFTDMQAKIGCPYLSDLPYYKRAVWFEMKRLCLSDYQKKQLEDFSRYVFGVPYAVIQEALQRKDDMDYYSITGKELPFADEVQEDTTIERLDDLYHTYESLPSDLKEDYGELMCYFTDLDELHRYRNDIIHYSWCKNMTDVARHILNNDPDFTSLSESVTRYFDYEAYGQYLDDNGRFVETDHGIYELP